ncbi:MAG: DEAD/DEAH box helicase, partial [Chloroflexota bacterium]
SLMPHISLLGDGLHVVEVDPVDPILQFSIIEEFDEETGEASIYLRAGFGYGSYAIDWSDKIQFHFWRMADYDPENPVELLMIKRNFSAETDYLKFFDHRKYGLNKMKQLGAGYFKLKRGLNAAEFLLANAPKLAADGYPLFGEQKLEYNRINRERPTLDIGVTSYTDWFDLKPLIQFGEIPVPLEQVKLAVKNRQPYVVLEDGALGQIPEEWFDQLKPMFGMGNQDGDSVRFGSQQVLLIDQLLQAADTPSPDDHFSERLADLQNFEGIADMPLSWAFTGQLRPYQQAGFNWLHFLRDYGYSGILADDMGLGKTVQVLAFLQSCRDLEDDEKPPDLIIMPRSLLFNWQREAERFTPNLRTLIYYGNKRGQELDYLHEVDLVFTTYGTILRDIEQLQEYDFNTIVLDESQAIKNPSAKTGRAIRLLNGRHRLAMTGTPIENTTLELWSQFAFLMPGYLGNQTYFREQFRNPIENKQDKKVAKNLHTIIRPFVMRRTKEQVALDLPSRTEEVIYLEMEPNQRRLYNKVRDQYRAELLGLIENGQMEESRMVLLTGLLRLRQICLHPKLVRPEFKGDAAKFIYLNDALDELEANDHRALIFSQFTSALDLIEDDLDGEGIPNVRIDGGTRNRQKVVDEFQESDQIPFFLLSLKAAGVGLNLTAADYVILMDPWWNPAVERQAIDRAYRIGQTKPVFVYRLIMRDSVEEKVLEMQARKREIADQLIQVEDSFVKQLSVDDIRSLFS